VEPVVVDVEQVLRGAGLRVTRPRIAVLEALAAHPHTDTGEVLADVRTRLDSVSHQAVYDCLATLTEAGLVRRIQPAGAIAHYELQSGDNHHHLVCRSCGAVVDVPCATGSAPCLDAAVDHGYAIDEAEVIYWGTCPACSVARIPT
jgi:Fur family ferric uptake transcriptional regulator